MHRAGGALAVRAFRPDATRVQVLDRSGRAVAELALVHPGGLFAGPIPRRQAAVRLSPAAAPRRRDGARRRRRVSLRSAARRDRHLPHRRRHAPSPRREARRARRDDRWMCRHDVRGLGAERGARQGRRRLQRLGRPAPPDAPARRERRLGDLRPAVGSGARYKYEIEARDGTLLPLKSRPARVRDASAAPRRPRSSPRRASRLDRRRVDGAPRRRQPPRRADLDLRSPPRLVAARPEERTASSRYARTRRRTDAIRRASWASRTSNCCRSPNIRSTGRGAISRSACSRRPAASARPTTSRVSSTRARAGLGVILDWVPGTFPTTRTASAQFDGTHLYEHADPRARLAARLGHARSTTSAAREVANFLIANALFWLERVSRRRLARRRRRLDALPRLSAASPASGCPTSFGGNENLEAIEFLRRFNELAYGDIPASSRSPKSRRPGRGSRRRRSGRPRLRLQMEHGLDARHARLHGRGPGLPQAITRRDDVRPACTRSARTTCCRSRTTRSCTGKVAARARCPATLAALRQPAAATTASCGPSRQEAAVHGRRVRAGARVGARSRPRLGSARATRAPRRAAAGARPQRALSSARRHCTSWTASPRASSGSTPTTRATASSRSLRAAMPGDDARRRGQLHARGARRLPASACRGEGDYVKLLNTDADRLRRQRRRQRRRAAESGRRGDGHAHSVATDAAAAGHRRTEARMTRRGRAPVWPGRPYPARRNVGRHRRQLRALLRQRGEGRAVPVRRARAARDSAGRAARVHRRSLARVSARTRARACYTATASTGRTIRRTAIVSTQTNC